ncbi:hypothetical protein B296_00050643 [Ensete ventricosum]|uniref:Uncharacterized protein n=1 Tax=Ensete ventricosum TaxID=4639 RepID=A0A426Y1N3_ENSVE|nr:hypothetical protein B296_00050643 [Ensete ventricosum]
MSIIQVPALSFEGSNSTIWGSGEWWMLLAAQSMAIGTVMVRWVSKYSDPVMATGWVVGTWTARYRAVLPKINRRWLIEGEIDCRQSIEGEINRRRSIEGEKGKKKKKRKRKRRKIEKRRKEIIPSARVPSSPTRRRRPRVTPIARYRYRDKLDTLVQTDKSNLGFDNKQ